MNPWEEKKEIPLCPVPNCGRFKQMLGYLHGRQQYMKTCSGHTYLDIPAEKSKLHNNK